MAGVEHMWELRIREGQRERTVHMRGTTWEHAARRYADLHRTTIVVAWRRCQCPTVEVLGDARRIIG